jgi:hypothetical protein
LRIARLPFGATEEAEFLISIGRSDALFLISSTIFGGGRHLALLANGKGFVGLETGFDYGDALAGGGVGLRHQLHADHEAARNDAGEADGLAPRPDFFPTGCPNCPRCHRLTGNAFKTLRFAVVDLGHGNIGVCRCRPKGLANERDPRPFLGGLAR